MIEKEQLPYSNSPNLNTMEIACLGATDEAILIPSSEDKTVYESKVAVEKIWDNLLPVQLTKLSQVLGIA